MASLSHFSHNSLSKTHSSNGNRLRLWESLCHHQQIYIWDLRHSDEDMEDALSRRIAGDHVHKYGSCSYEDKHQEELQMMEEIISFGKEIAALIFIQEKKEDKDDFSGSCF